jgi:NAD(P)-dependent dehydrogenase (short-subunit alcohol dehydrogenase family)
VGQKEQQLNRLQGKVAVITGGSSGMGFATAEQFVSEGRTYTSLGGERKSSMLPLRKLERISRPSRGTLPTWKTLTGSTRRLQRIRGALTSKAAVRSLARSWTIDLKDRRIRVNTISPGYTETSIFETLDWTKEQFEAVKAGITKTIPLGRWAYSEEIAKAAVFLASDESAMWLVSSCS